MRCWFIALLLCAVTASAVEPAFVLPGAVRLERRADGGMTATLSDGARAWIQPIREGYSVSYSDCRAAERWSRTASGYSVTRLGPGISDVIRRVDGKVATKSSGARVRVFPTRDGWIAAEDGGPATRWSPTRTGWTATPTTP